MALTTDLQCLLVNPYSLNEMNRIDLNGFDLKKMSKMFKIAERDEIIVYGKTLEKVSLILNEQKVKQIRRNKYQHLNKVKLLDNELPPVEVVTQDTVHKVKVT